MKCPNCNKEMKDESYWYYGLGSWDMDYPDQLHEEYCCSNCNIKLVNGEWTIPKSIIATEKQLNETKIHEKQLKQNLNDSKIELEMFYTVYENITEYEQIKE